MERFPAGGGSFANLKSFVGEGKSSHNRDLKPKCINPVGFCLEQLGSIFTGLRIIDLNSRVVVNVVQHFILQRTLLFLFI